MEATYTHRKVKNIYMRIFLDDLFGHLSFGAETEREKEREQEKPE